MQSAADQSFPQQLPGPYALVKASTSFHAPYTSALLHSSKASAASVKVPQKLFTLLTSQASG